MSHKLNDITLYYNEGNSESEKRFTGLQNVISQLYVHFLNGYKPKGTSRISVSLGEKEGPISYAGSVLVVHKSFDKKHFWNLNHPEQRLALLNTIHDVAMYCSEKFNWDKEVFEEAYKAVIQNNFEFKIEYQKKKSRNRNYSASVVKIVRQDKTTIYVRVYDKSGKFLKEVELLSSPSHEMFYGSIIKKSKWLNNSDFGFAGDIFSLYVSVDDLQVKTSLSEKMVNDYTRRMQQMHLQYLDFQGKESLLGKIR